MREEQGKGGASCWKSTGLTLSCEEKVICSTWALVFYVLEVRHAYARGRRAVSLSLSFSFFLARFQSLFFKLRSPSLYHAVSLAACRRTR